MGSYRALFKESVAKDLRVIPKRDVVRILKRIERLTDDPRGPGCERLAGRELYRVRQGSYRVLYEIQDADRSI
jgi:mRNA interferase RelE/StbE